MLISILIMLLLVLVVFGFVLEPLVRARRDRVELDAATLPEPIPDFRELAAPDVEDESARGAPAHGMADVEAAEGRS